MLAIFFTHLNCRQCACIIVKSKEFYETILLYLCCMEKIAIFASGSGTNAQRIIEYFKRHPSVSVDLVLSNNPEAFVLTRAGSAGIPAIVFSRKEFYETEKVLSILKERNITFIVLAGFLWLIPDYLLRAYRDKIVNIHPALLPGYGGKGMYGMRVHEAVIKSGDKESGITIHMVNEKYDEGQIIFQARCKVEPDDTPESLAKKIHALEYEHYPRSIESLTGFAKK
jgi:phosphoribosylglycinamide formyltransferase-1